MPRFLSWSAALLLAASAALAQPATESVTVTAARLRDQIRSFVQSLAAPSPAIGKLTRR